MNEIKQSYAYCPMCSYYGKEKYKMCSDCQKLWEREQLEREVVDASVEYHLLTRELAAAITEHTEWMAAQKFVPDYDPAEILIRLEGLKAQVSDPMEAARKRMEAAVDELLASTVSEDAGRSIEGAVSSSS